jgi:hypothetical protein
VNGSFVGMKRFLAAFHHGETALSRWEGVGEAFSIGGMECERAGETCLRGVAGIARYFSSMRRLGHSSTSWVRICSASHR